MIREQLAKIFLCRTAVLALSCSLEKLTDLIEGQILAKPGAPDIETETVREWVKRPRLEAVAARGAGMIA